MIEAGRPEQIRWEDATWVFLDLGFSNNARSCGLLIGDESPRCLRFADAKREVLSHVFSAQRPVHIVLEAPLSVCFDQRGNPKGRAVDTEGKQARYWYFGAACAVMVAAMYLVRPIVEGNLPVAVRLFEGFVSHKKAGTRSNHQRDVCLLREVVKNPGAFSSSIHPAESLRSDPTDEISSAFRIVGFDCGVPVVIKPPAVYRGK
jgi:hypothetical protein